MKSDSSETQIATRLLDGIRSPADVKALREQDLPQLAQEVRDELVKVLSQTGGHLGPNLGVVELTIALHRVFETPRDRFVMDVSHQGYVHKMLTGTARSHCDDAAIRRPERFSFAHGKRTRLLRRRSRRHGALGRARHGGRPRFARRRRKYRGGRGRRGVYLRHQLRGAQQCSVAHEEIYRRPKRQRVVDREKRRRDRVISKRNRDQSNVCAFARQSAPVRGSHCGKVGGALRA